jgi:hypothetical protein
MDNGHRTYINYAAVVMTQNNLSKRDSSIHLILKVILIFKTLITDKKIYFAKILTQDKFSSFQGKKARDGYFYLKSKQYYLNSADGFTIFGCLFAKKVKTEVFAFLTIF